MAYIATKATYTGTEEYIEEGTNIIKNRIVTDVDNVVFETGEVIVLIEKEDEDQHFDLNIEDKGSEYFRPTQIKIGDGFHSFKELNWIQTFDPSRVNDAVSNGVTQATSEIIKDFNGLSKKVDDFIYIDASKILQELVKGEYFTLNDNGVLSCFNTEGVSNNELKSLSVGYNNNFIYNNNTGKRCVIFGENNKVSGFYNYINGIGNIIENNNFGIISGAGNKFENTSDNNKCYNTCFGYSNTIKIGDANLISGYKNKIFGYYNTCFGNSNTTGYESTDGTIIGQYNFTYGNGNKIGNQVAGQNYNICFGKENKISGTYNFTCGLKNIIKNHNYSFSFGDNNSVIGNYGFAGGYNSYSNTYSIAYGDRINRKLIDNSQIPGKYSFGFGSMNNTKGDFTFSCGIDNNSNSNYTFSYGLSNNINGLFSVGFGKENNVYGFGSIACGYYNVVYGNNSFACGHGNKVYGKGSFACGEYNIGDNKIFSIGNGTMDNCSNAFDIDTNGKATFYGDLDVKGNFNEEQLKSSVFGFRTTSTKNLYELATLGETSNNIVSTNYFTFKGIYEIIIIPKDQEIQSVYTDSITGSKNIPFNQPFYIIYNGSTSDRLNFQLNSGVTGALVYIIIRKISD